MTRRQAMRGRSLIATSGSGEIGHIDYVAIGPGRGRRDRRGDADPADGPPEWPGGALLRPQPSRQSQQWPRASARNLSSSLADPVRPDRRSARPECHPPRRWRRAIAMWSETAALPAVTDTDQGHSMGRASPPGARPRLHHGRSRPAGQADRLRHDTAFAHERCLGRHTLALAIISAMAAARRSSSRGTTATNMRDPMSSRSSSGSSSRRDPGRVILMPAINAPAVVAAIGHRRRYAELIAAPGDRMAA